MDKVESNEEALLVESYVAFVNIRERSSLGTLTILFSFVFMIFIPIFLLLIFPLDMWGDSEGTELCCGSVLLGLAMIVGGTVQSIAHWSRYKKATQNLANAAGIPKKIAYPLFSLQAADKRINSLVLQKYPFLSESKENSNKTKPRKVVLSKREED